MSIPLNCITTNAQRDNLGGMSVKAVATWLQSLPQEFQDAPFEVVHSSPFSIKRLVAYRHKAVEIIRRRRVCYHCGRESEALMKVKYDASGETWNKELCPGCAEYFTSALAFSRASRLVAVPANS